MASKSSSPGPNATPSTPAKPTRSRKGSTPNQTEQGRAGSAGGVMLPKKTVAKAPASTEKKTAAIAATTSAAAATMAGADDAATTGAKTPKKRPRKLNKEPTSTPDKTNSPTLSKTPNESLTNHELEALKARVRELEAKMEELYKTRGIPDSRAARSPRRRGKGRKMPSTEQVPQVKTTENNVDASGPRIQEVVNDDEEEADEELSRLEGELEVARQDLEHYRPRMRRTRSNETDFVEEIPWTPSRAGGGERQVTLSGSYRIPIPASVNLEDVQTIKSGVSAAQNLARSFLEQRRAAAAAARAQSTTTAQETQPSPSSRSSTSTKVPSSKTRGKRSPNPNVEVAMDNSGTKQSWGDWIGGYSLAISRAVSKIEHEAAVEAQMTGGNGNGGGGGARPKGSRRMSVPTSKKMAGKRPAAKPTLSAEQVHGLMS